MTRQPSLKLYLLLLGCRPPGRHVEQHDFFLGIGTSLKELVPAIKAFWREAAAGIHIDAWREVTAVDGYQISVVPKEEAGETSAEKLFFINLGGYQPGKFEEQHYVVLTVKTTRELAIKEAKTAAFFKYNSLTAVKGAKAHIDDKYGIDVDDIYNIQEMLPSAHKKNTRSA